MTRKQETFAAEYLIDLCAAKAAIRAGYSFHTAAEIGSELLKNPDISAAIERGMAQRAIRVNMKADYVLHEMSLLSHSRIDHYIVDEDGDVALAEGAPEGALAAVQSIKRTRRTNRDGHTITTIEIKLWDKIAPLTAMGRHVGLFPQRLEHSGPNGRPIETVTRIERVVLPDLPPGTLADTEREGANPAPDEHIIER